MKTRLLAALGTSALLAVTLFAPVTARAAANPAAAADDCSVTGTSPEVVSIGLKPVTVQFDVGTDCDDEDHKMEWAVSGQTTPAGPVGWFGACTYAYVGPNVLTCPSGRAKIDVIGTGPYKGNQMAGPHKISTYAFDDENANDQDDDATGSIGESTITFRHRTSWGTTFNASPEPRRKGQTIKVTGSLSFADWDTGRYKKFGAYVKLQFKGDGEESYHSVRTVWDNGASATTTLKAVRSGALRYYYPGDATHAPSASKGDYIKVLPKKK